MKPTLRREAFRAWLSMQQKCLSTKHPEFHTHGGIGVEVDDRWFDFNKFLKDMGLPPDSEFEIGRVNPKEGFHRHNCVWRLADCGLVLEQRPLQWNQL